MHKPDMAPAEIGERARMIRKRRGMPLVAAAGLAGISPSYLSMLENGQRRFERRSLLENLANALGCSVIDLTGEPYAPSDRESADTLATVPLVRMALNDYGPEDRPDVTPRPLDALLTWTDEASQHRDQAHYAAAGRHLGDLLTELQVHAHAGNSADRSRALGALVESWVIAGAVMRTHGYVDLAVSAARRAYDTARLLDEPALLGFARWFWSYSLVRVAAHNRAAGLLTTAINELEPAVQFDTDRTAAAEMLGLMHLTAAQTAARERRDDDAYTHWDEAAAIAGRTGERNWLRRHFGPTNIAAWRLSIGIELGDGARAYADATAVPIDTAALGSVERTAALHLDLARALAQENGPRDWDAIRHLDTADRTAPQLVRPDPIARELVASLDNRTRTASWELRSLRHRFGLSR
jgi:transcriptional regulator with XRE-family HTH domain